MTITIPSGQPNNRFMRYVTAGQGHREASSAVSAAARDAPTSAGDRHDDRAGRRAAPRWWVYHPGCDPHRGEDDWYRIEATEVQTLRDLFTVTLDLLDNEWFGGTDWRAFCRRTLSMSPR
jgi:hypothetical protein